MAKIVITTLGTHGEVRPVIALALKIRERNHDVTVCGPPNEEAWIKQFGFSFTPIGCDMVEMLNKENKNIGNPLKSLTNVKAIFNEMLSYQMPNLKNAIEGADLVVNAGSSFITPTVCEYFKIPFCYVIFVMQFLPSSHHPPTMFSAQNMPGFLNSLIWKITNSSMTSMMRPKVEPIRRELGLGKLPDFVSYMLQSEKIIVAVDKQLAVVPDDTKLDCYQTGRWDMPPKDEEELDPALLEFINRGEKPVFFGFGSSTDKNPRRTLEIFLQTIRELNIRAIIQKGWAELDGEVRKNEDIFFAGYAPHNKLFPLMKAVVHAGGPGTVSSALRAGIPQIIVPHMLDHYYCGEQMFRKGLGPRAISKGKLTAGRLINAVREGISNKAMENRAREVAREMAAQEDPVISAVNCIEQYIK